MRNCKFWMCLLLVLVTGTGACIMDGTKTAGEECDDGNMIVGDGCTPACKLEAGWICTQDANSLTTCCPQLQHPGTLDYTCSCANMSQPIESMGYYISDQCVMHDTNECTGAINPCHPNAYCINHNAIQSCLLTYECVCPPGMHGNGVDACDIRRFATGFTLLGNNLEYYSRHPELITLLQSTEVIPSSVNPSDVGVVATLFYSSQPVGSRRSSDGTVGVEYAVTIFSESEEAMQNMTTAVDVTAVSTNFTVLTPPASERISDHREAIDVQSGGIRVESMTFSASTNTWLLDVRYNGAMENTLMSPFVSKVGASRSSDDILKTFNIGEFPCADYSSVCCLLEYTRDYVTGGFSGVVGQALGTCNSTVQDRNTLGLIPSPTNPQEYVWGLLDDYADSDITTSGTGRFSMKLASGDLESYFAEKVSYVDNHFELNFFVGMAYISPLTTTGISTSASQKKLTVSVSPTLTFSFSSGAEYAFVEFLTVSIRETSYIAWTGAVATLHKMQYAMVGLVLPLELLQNMQTGIVPMGSIRFAFGVEMPDRSNTALWTNPCFSSDDTGMYDSTATIPSLYQAASYQACARPDRLCTNPPQLVGPDRFVKFGFPLGDTRMDDNMQAAGDTRLFVTFQLSAMSQSGEMVLSDLFLETIITPTTIAKACDVTLEEHLALGNMVEVSLAVGIAGHNGSEWDNTIVQVDDVMQVGSDQELVDTGVTKRSLASSLITMVVKGGSDLVASRSTTSHVLTIDSLTTMHFLDPQKFSDVQAMMVQGTAFTVSSDTQTGFSSVTFTSDATESCSDGNTESYSCGVQDLISAGVRTQATGVCDFATADLTDNDASCSSFLTTSLLGGNTTFSSALATNMTKLVREKYALDNYLRRAWYINPGFTWPIPARSTGPNAIPTPALSDKMLAVASITLRNAQTGGVSSRRLMTIVSSPEGGVTTRETHLQHQDNPLVIPDAMDQVRKNPLQSGTPTIAFNVDVVKTATAMMNMPVDQRTSMSTMGFTVVSTKTNRNDISQTLVDHVQSRRVLLCDTCEVPVILFRNVKARNPMVPGRMLLQSNTQAQNEYDVLLTFLSSHPSNATIPSTVAIEKMLQLDTVPSMSVQLMSYNLVSETPATQPYNRPPTPREEEVIITSTDTTFMGLIILLSVLGLLGCIVVSVMSCGYESTSASTSAHPYQRCEATPKDSYSRQHPVYQPAGNTPSLSDRLIAPSAPSHSPMYANRPLRQQMQSPWASRV
jgi:cysteine-rich repeat protein